MGNRILRCDKYTPDDFIRISFRDENGERIRSHVGKQFIKEFVRYKLTTDLRLAGKKFRYFGSSNSQMREQGCYMMAAEDEEIAAFRRSLGNFSMKSVPKLMARLGQCFTQACVSRLLSL